MKMLRSKKVVRYDFTKKPWKVRPLLWLAHLIGRLHRAKRKTKVTYIGEKPSRPRLVLGNHGAFNDFYMLFKAFPSYHINYIVAIDAFNDAGDLTLRSLGAIAKRKFISDLSLMKNMKYCVETLKNTVVMYPEARYSLDGTTSYLPDSLGKLVKFLKVPVSVLMCCGNYVSDPQWNKYKQDRMPMEATVKEIVSEEETETLSVSEINRRIRENFVYDDWKWLRESGNKITYKNRAFNLNAILYQCPHCKTEFDMQGEGEYLTCNSCKKSWFMHENGNLEATTGETEFTYIPDWFAWQKQNVHEEVFSGKYSLDADCDVYTLPHAKGFVAQGKGKLHQDSEKTVLTVNLYGENKVIEYLGTNLESVHVEYRYKDAGDMFDFSIRGDSVWMHPVSRKDILTKVSLATEEIRDLAKLKLHGGVKLR